MNLRLTKMRSSISVTYITLLLISAVLVGVFNITTFSQGIWSIFVNYNLANEDHHEVVREIFLLNASLGFACSFFYVILGFFGSLQLKSSAKKVIRFIDEYQLNDKKIMSKMDTGDEFEVIVDSFRNLVIKLEKTSLSKNYLEIIMNSMADAVLILDSDGIIKWCNYSVETLLGYKRDQIVDKDISVLISLSLKLNNRYVSDYVSLDPREIVAKKIDLNRSKTVVNSIDGNTLPVLLTTTTINVNGNREVVLVLQDMRKAVAEEEDKKIIQAQLVSSSKLASLGEMGSGIAHELNNPLTVINGFAEILEDNMKKGEVKKEILELGLKQILNNANRMAAIVKNLRTFSSSSEGEVLKDIPFIDILNTVLGLCDQKYRAYGVDIQVGVYDPELTIYGSRSQLAQVFVSLFSNAYDAIKTLDEKWIRIDIEDTYDMVTFRVMDSGTTPSADICDKMFTPFFSTKITSESTGLGLSVAYRMIVDHRGNISIDREQPHTTFVLNLPKKRSVV